MQDNYFKIIRWYILPLIILHEFSHFIISFLLINRVRKIVIDLSDKYKIFNGYVLMNIPNKKWKMYLISYSPLLMMFPFFLIYYQVFFYFSLYLLTTIIYYDNQIIFMCLPSKGDLDKIKYYEYNKYLLNELGEEYYILEENGKLNNKIEFSNLFTYTEFENIKK